MNAAISAAVAGETRAAIAMTEVRRDLEALENEAYGRGWRDGVDSTAQLDGSMYVIVYGFFALSGALMGGTAVWWFLR